MSEVSRRFRRLASSPAAWRALCMRLHPEWAAAQMAALDTRTFNWKLAYARRVKLAARDSRPPRRQPHMSAPAGDGALAAPAAGRRELCGRCQRPPATCFCAALPPRDHPLLANERCRVLILQDTKTQVSIGTVQLLRLALTHCDVIVDRDFSEGRYPLLDEVLARGDALLLFPALNARTVLEHHASFAPARAASPTRSLTLIAIDGSWRTAKAIHRWNPRIALNTVPVHITHTAPSVFGAIKREPKAHFLSTMEAVVKAVAGLLHGDEDLILPLMLPSLEHIVRTQQEFNERFTAQRAAERALGGLSVHSSDEDAEDADRPRHTAERSLPIHGRVTRGKPWRKKKQTAARRRDDGASTSDAASASSSAANAPS